MIETVERAATPTTRWADRPRWQRLAWVTAKASRPSQLLLIGGVYLFGVAIAGATGTAVSPAAAIAGLAVLPTAASVHYINEYADYDTDRLTDRTPFSGGSGALQATGIAPVVARRLALLALAVGAVTAAAGWVAGLLGPAAVALLASIAVLGWAYSVGPALARRGVGELDNALLGGLLLPAYGAAAVGGPAGRTALAAVPFALVVFVNLLDVHWPDRRADAAVGKDTLVVRLPTARLRELYVGLSATAGASLLVLVGLGVVAPVVAGASLIAAPLLGWGAITYPRDAPRPGVFAMVTLVIGQALAWGWLWLTV